MGRGVGASAAADAVPLQNAHRNHADFRIRVEPTCNTPFEERSAHRIRQDGLNFIVVSADKQNECFWRVNISQPMENFARSLETNSTQRQWNPGCHSAEPPSGNECSFSAISKAWWTKRPAAHRPVISSQFGNPPMEDVVSCELDS